MYISVFELFKIGIGPSSSHTVGPMVAASNFLNHIKNDSSQIENIKVFLYGSLAYTGVGHKTYEAILLGLNGYKPEIITNTDITRITKQNATDSILTINNNNIIFDYKKDIIPLYNKKFKNKINPLVFKCTLQNGTVIDKTYYSIGGGFITEDLTSKNNNETTHFTYNFKSMAELQKICQNKNNIFDVILENECCLDDLEVVKEKILFIWSTMNDTIKNGMKANGVIDEVLKVDKRASLLYKSIKRKDRYDPLDIMDWINVFAIATSEENASGNKIVTAPTNGASGIIPAVIKYYDKFIPDSNDNGIINFIATSSSIGMLFKINASISGSEMGCQGEVGVACSMAAAGLTAALGGTVNQIENAAEIAMEHNLGLTCDPVKGLVQIPCIERNSMGAIKAINSSRLAMSTTRPHKVSLDTIIKTMYDTGKSMNSIFKETSLGGLAVNVVEC